MTLQCRLDVYRLRLYGIYGFSFLHCPAQGCCPSSSSSSAGCGLPHPTAGNQSLRQEDLNFHPSPPSFLPSSFLKTSPCPTSETCFLPNSSLSLAFNQLQNTNGNMLLGKENSKSRAPATRCRVFSVTTTYHHNKNKRRKLVQQLQQQKQNKTQRENPTLLPRISFQNLLSSGL